MRRAAGIVILYGLVANPMAWAQGYFPLLDTTAHWYDSFWAGDPGPGTSISECNKYFLVGDTLVNDTAYHFLRVTGSYHFELIEPPYFTDSAMYTSVLVGLIREDTAARKVFFRPTGWPTDQLLYDFSAGLGPYPWTYLFGTDQLTVIAIDTVAIGNTQHRRLELDGSINLIEGVGSSLGFMPPGIYGQWMAGGLSCHTIAGVSDYRIEGWWNTGCVCDAPVGIREADHSDIQVWPNPTSGFCNVKGANAGSTYSLLSMDGRLLLDGRCNGSGMARISLFNFPNGMYVLKLKDGSNEQYFRVVKE